MIEKSHENPIMSIPDILTHGIFFGFLVFLPLHFPPPLLLPRVLFSSLLQSCRLSLQHASSHLSLPSSLLCHHLFLRSSLSFVLQASFHRSPLCVYCCAFFQTQARFCFSYPTVVMHVYFSFFSYPLFILFLVPLLLYNFG